MSYEPLPVTKATMLVLSIILLFFAAIAMLQTLDIVNAKTQELMDSRSYEWTPLEVKPTLSSPDNLQPAVGSEWLR